MKLEQPPIPRYDNINKKKREGRDTLCWQFYCTACGFVFGSCNDSGARDYTMKRLANQQCEKCGASGDNWAYRSVSD